MDEVKDGHTIVIGGLFRDESTTTRSQIPFLGDLPIIALSWQTDQTIREEPLRVEYRDA